MLEIKGVKKSYGEFQLDCSLNVEKGRITGLVGENVPRYIKIKAPVVMYAEATEYLELYTI